MRFAPETPSADPTGPPEIPEALRGLDLSALNGAISNGASQLSPQDQLQSALQGTLYDISGRNGAFGRPKRNSVLPPWLDSLAPEIVKHPDFDPYLGQLSVEGDEMVYMGTKVKKEKVYTGAGTRVGADGMPVKGRPGRVETRTSEVDKAMTVLQAKNMPVNWDEDEMAEAIKKMRAAGLDVTTFEQVNAAWGSLVDRAALTYAASNGERKLTPWDALELRKSEAAAAGIDLSAQGPFTGNKTQVQRSVSEVSEGEAWSVMQRTVSEMLGRDPSDDELRDFTYRMNGMAAKNPSISKTVTSYKNGDPTSSSTHTDPGFTSADMAQNAYEDAQDDTDYAEYQSASTYFNAALSALGPIGG